ncbi:hypothetical protein PQB76_gp063 [Arthrobacter phage Cheesy]|uniref:Uncharacterized protein n=1 Tax=Arthrobacter phage Cheesy TaxID=2015816 RepID=A0A222ZK22_9CAUD|nr:hypothetical protein PQB76_gp063 [Arthrobacter phage Cheesy]ASR84642.1 hypothetical protein SEA_CHEESY_63 [Arthrobacter phage Cheesy]
MSGRSHEINYKKNCWCGLDHRPGPKENGLNPNLVIFDEGFYGSEKEGNLV